MKAYLFSIFVMMMMMMMMMSAASLAQVKVAPETVCQASQKLKEEFMSLDPANDKPEFIRQAYLKYEGAWEIMDKFANSSKNSNEKSNEKSKDREIRFGCIVELAAAALPWDGEGRSIGLLADLLKDTKLKEKYESTLKQFSDGCRADLLRESVKAKICNSAGAEDPADSVHEGCDDYFKKVNHFKECLAAKHKK